VFSYEMHFAPSAHNFVLSTAFAGHRNLRFSTNSSSFPQKILENY